MRGRFRPLADFPAGALVSIPWWAIIITGAAVAAGERVFHQYLVRNDVLAANKGLREKAGWKRPMARPSLSIQW
ncbi:MAG: hypothetical protein D9V47_08960 [Clostridia bacterium]|nr:MAG: hypothetical protein D9V47_08960 [Clostridia bacterium]